MSQALELAAIPEYIPIPKGTSHKQFRLAKALLSPDADKKTRAELMKEAGYTEISAYANAAVAIGSNGTQRAIEEITKATRDRAGDIDRLASSELVNRLQPDKVGDLGALELANIWGGARKVRNEYPETDPGVGEADHQNARAYMVRIVTAVLVATGVDIMAHPVAQLVDNAMLTASASDNR